MTDEYMINENMGFDSVDLTDTNTIRNLCKKYHLKPSRQKGQNFLINRRVVQTIIKAAELQPNDTVLEVGPGLGAITQELVRGVKKVVAIEIDSKMVKILKDLFTQHQEKDLDKARSQKLSDRRCFKAFYGRTFGAGFAGSRSLKVFLGNALKLDLARAGLKDLNYKVVANLPYNITSHFIRQRLTQSPRPEQMVLIVQKEVADRICAKPGKTSLLSISVQFYAQPKLIEIISKDSFWPEPKVDSAIIKIENISQHRKKLVKDKKFNDEKFFQIVRIGFSARRKMLKNNLAAGSRHMSEIERVLEQVGLDKKVRAQDLGVEDWIRLAQSIET